MPEANVYWSAGLNLASSRFKRGVATCLVAPPLQEMAGEIIKGMLLESYNLVSGGRVSVCIV